MNIRELREESVKIANQARALLDTITNENRSEKEAQFDRMMSDSDSYAERANRAERAEARGSEFDAIATKVVSESVSVEGRSDKSEAEQRAAAFEGYLRGETRAQSIGNDSGTKGGVLVPTEVEAAIIKAMKDYGPLTEGGPATVYLTGHGHSVKLPYNDNTAGTASAKTENAAASAKDVTVSAATLSVSTYDSGLFQVSNELIRDSVFDVSSFVTGLCAENLGYKANSVHTTNLLGGASAATFNAAATGAITGDELIKLAYDLSAPYRRNGGFMFNSKTELAVRLLKDGENRYLWQPSFDAGKPATIAGYQYWTNEDMPDMAASAKAIVFGDMKRFAIRRAGNIELKRSDELYIASNAVAFIGFMSIGSVVTDAKAIKYLSMAAS